MRPYCIAQGTIGNTFLFFCLIPRHMGSQFPDQGSNPYPLQQKPGVLTTGLPGKSLQLISCNKKKKYQSLSRVRPFVTPWTAACQASLSITNSWNLLKLMSIKLVRPSNHLILCCPLLLPPSIFPSIRVFSNESVLHIRWPKYQSFSFCMSPSSEYSGLISFRIDWLNLLAVQGTVKNLLQYHSSKISSKSTIIQ